MMLQQKHTFLLVLVLASVLIWSGCTVGGSDDGLTIVDTDLDTEEEWVFPVYTFEEQIINEHLPGEIEVELSDGSSHQTEITWIALQYDEFVAGENTFMAFFNVEGVSASEEVTVVLVDEEDA